MADNRSPERLRAHYEIEKSLADRLRAATKEERALLYQSVYDDLYKAVPDHPQLARKAKRSERSIEVGREMQVLERFSPEGCTFLELGPGDCALSFEMCRRASHVFALDVSDEITRVGDAPKNFSLLLTDGTAIPVEAGAIDVAYGNQLMEHLHPDDAEDQLKNIVRALKAGGVYVCGP